MRIKKNCFGCKALSLKSCILGYKITTYEILGVHGAGIKPLEICPKPKTMEEYIYLYNNR